MRGPRGLLGPPHQQPARPPGRDVLRLLPAGRHHDPRGSRPGRPRAGPPDDLTSCRLDPARALVAVLTRMPAAGIRLGDILDDSGYAHRDAEAWAIPLRQAGAQLVQDLTRTTADPAAPTRAPSSPTA